MSGGSFDYLCFKEPAQLLENPSELDAMADFLKSHGYADDAAKETLQILYSIEHFKTRMDARLERMQGVWRAAEWWRSGDTGEDGLQSALAEYRKDIEPEPVGDSI